MTYYVSAVKVTEVTKIHEQSFNTFEAAQRARDFLRSKGYTAVVLLKGASS